MRLTESQMRRIIAEEIEAMIQEGELDEGFFGKLKSRLSGAQAAAGGKASALGTGLAGAASKLGSAAAGALGAKGAAAEMAAKGVERAQAAKDANQAADQAGTNAKVASLKKSFGGNLTRINKALTSAKQEFSNDAKALDLDVGDAIQTIDNAIQTLNNLQRSMLSESRRRQQITRNRR